MMPDMDGLELLTELRKRPDTRLLPVIFVTARAERSDVRLGMQLGADDYITKPFTRMELLQAVATRLARQAEQQQKVDDSLAALHARAALYAAARTADAADRHSGVHRAAARRRPDSAGRTS